MRDRAALLLIVLCFVAAMKQTYRPGIGRNSLDGDYYYQVARNVAEGRGLQTNVSLYHQGLRELPHPTNIYPLWPLVLGIVGRWISLPAAATLVPALLYLVDLVLLYLVARRVDLRIRGPEAEGRLLDAGVVTPAHATVLILAVNPVFFNFTSLPYTEALAFAWLFAGLLALDRAADARPLLWSAVAGLCAGLAFLTRSQMIGLVVGLIVVLVAAAATRRRWLAAAGLAAAAFALPVVPWVRFLMSWVEPFRPRVMLTIGAYRELPEVAPFRWNHGADSRGELILDRLTGVRVAFDPWDPNSYVESFGLAAWLVPLVLGAVLIRRWSPREDFERITRPSRMIVVAMLVAAAVQLLPLQLLHARYLSEWRFAHRHGLALILVIAVAFPYLLSRGNRWLRLIAISLVAASILSGTFRSVHLLRARFPSGLLGAEPELVDWLEGHDAPPTVITTNAQTLSVFSRAGFHWMECRESSEKTRQLVAGAGVDYLIVYGGEEFCGWLRGLDDYRPVRAFGEGRSRITVLAPPGDAAPASQP